MATQMRFDRKSVINYIAKSSAGLFSPKRVWHLAILLLLLPLLQPTARAQVDTGSIVGTVTDTSGAIVPGAAITIKDESTGRTLVLESGQDGTYSISPLKIGAYTMTVAKAGFQTLVQQHIEVTVQGHLQIDPKLQVGQVTQEIQVSSSGPILETQSSSIQQLVNQRAINDLPLNGRNAVFLAQLSPGVTQAQNDSRGLQASGSFTANGSRRTQNDYLLDGMDDNVAIADLVNQAQFVVLPPPDALREFTVQTSDYSAEFGHAAGAVLNVTTKSGSNNFHGDLWEFVRNDYFDAKDYFVQSTQRKPEYRLNQFGGTFGGPLTIPHVYDGKDKTFFFVDYQGTRIVQGKTYTQTVPTAAENASGFANLQDLITLQTGTKSDLLGRTFPSGTVFDPATTRAVTANAVDPVTTLTATGSGFVRDPFYNGTVGNTTNFANPGAEALMNTIPSGRINPVAVGLLNLLPAPTKAGVLTNNYTVSPNLTTDIDGFDTRFDEVFSPKDSAFARYSYVYSSQFQPSPFPGVADGAPSRPGTGWTESQNEAISETHIFSPRLVLEVRAGYSRVADLRVQYDAGVQDIPKKYGIQGIPQNSTNGGLPTLNFGILSAMGAAGTIPSSKASDIFQVSENLSIDRGRHQIRVGDEYQYIVFPTLTPTTPRGSFTNNGTYTSIVNVNDTSTDRAQFVVTPEASTVGGINNVGGANTMSASNFPPAFRLVRPYFGVYAQDNWRTTSKLTLNLGLRWDFIGAPEEANSRFANMVPAQTGSIGTSTFYMPQSQVASEPANILALLAKDGITFTPVNGNSLIIAQKTNFAPRVGFAYQVLPKLVLRGGSGIFYQGNENHGLSVSNYVNFPFQITTSYTSVNAATPLTPDNSVGALQNGLLNVPLTSAAAAASSSTALSLLGEPRNAKSSYAIAYNLQFQYQLTPETVVEAGYVGTVSRHVQVGLNANTLNAILPPSANQKANSFFPDFATGGTFIARAGATNYHSLQVNAQHRFSHDFSLLANFTFSKCLGDTRDLLDNGVGSYRAPYVPGMGIGADYGLCDINAKRIVHASGIYQLPFGKNERYLHSGAGAWLAGGWSFNGILTATDGQPLTIACSTTNAAGLGCNALKVAGQNPYSGSHNAKQFLNPNAFVNPPAATASSATIANLGGKPTQVSGPPYRRLNLSLFRQFPAPAETHFEFRAEVFNLTNTANFAQPGNLNFTTPNTFASISATRDNPEDPREIQLSLKYYF
jgi:hypothetical protein